MTQALANQLRLVRDAAARLAGTARIEDKATLGAMNALLSELIAEQLVPTEPGAALDEEIAEFEATELSANAERQARAVEAPGGEAIDLDALAAFLAGAVPGEGPLHITRCDTVSRGMSKKTMLVRIEGNRVLPADLALRVDRTSNNYLGTTVLDEYAPLELLSANGARIPRPWALEPSGKVIGDPFIVFDRAAGGPVGGNYVAPPPNPELIADIAGCLAAIHAVPTDPWPRPEQPQGRAFIDREIDDYRRDWRAIGARSAIVDACFDWIEANRERAYGPPVLTHNDFNFNNMLVEGSRVAAVLDWEFVHVGTAASDLGYFYYSAEAVSSFDDVLNHYAAAGGTVPPRAQLDFYILWGQLRLVVMGFKAVANLEAGRFDDVRYGICRWHRRQGLLRVADLLARVRTGGLL